VSDGSGVFNGNLHGAGTLNVVTAGSVNFNSSDNSDATGYLNLIPDPAITNGIITVRIGSQGAGGNMFWNLPTTVPPKVNMVSAIRDPWVVDLTMGGLAGNGTLQGFNTGAIANKVRWIIGAAGLDSTYSGAIIDGTGTPNNPINGNAAATAIAKVGAGSLVLTGAGFAQRGETIVNQGVLVLDGAGGPLAGNLQNSPLVQVNGGTLLMRNGAQSNRWNSAAVVGDVTSGLVFSVNSIGVIDLSQLLNFIGNTNSA